MSEGTVAGLPGDAGVSFAPHVLVQPRTPKHLPGQRHTVRLVSGRCAHPCHMFSFFAPPELHQTTSLRCVKKAKGVRHMKDSILVIFLLLGAIFVIVYDLFAFVGM